MVIQLLESNRFLVTRAYKHLLHFPFDVLITIYNNYACSILINPMTVLNLSEPFLSGILIQRVKKVLHYENRARKLEIYH